MLRALADAVKKVGGHPVIVPSMGTHGGGSNKGQIEILSSLGITESAVAAAIRSSADTVLLGQTDAEVPVYCNIEATKMDRLIVINVRNPMRRNPC